MFETYPDVVTTEQLMDMLQIGKSKAYELLRTNRLHYIRVGRRYLIPKRAIIGFLNDICYTEGTDN